MGWPQAKGKWEIPPNAPSYCFSTAYPASQLPIPASRQWAGSESLTLANSGDLAPNLTPLFFLVFLLPITHTLSLMITRAGLSIEVLPGPTWDSKGHVGNGSWK